MPKLADTVVYRHPCHCESASRAPEPGEEEEHRFDVDGEPFPYVITERGPAFSRSGNGLYLVRLEIFPALRGGDGFGSFTHRHGHAPAIAGLEFPWWISEAGLMYSSSRKEVPVIRLGFFAQSVDADCEITGVADTFEMTGNLIARAEASQ